MDAVDGRIALGGSILIVDDSSTSRMIVQRCIEMAGIEAAGFIFAENGLEAIAALRSAKEVSAIVTDINMPKMDGRAFLGILKSDPATRAIPVVVVSSIAVSGPEGSAVAEGAAAFVGKPVSPAKMLAAFRGLPR